jgi:uncharacterized protein (DUF4415 family)
MKKLQKASKADDNPPWSATEVAAAKPLQALPSTLRRKLVGRPKSAVTKEAISIRLSHEVVAQFRAGGTGWQTRIDAALKEWLKNHPQRS